MDQVKSTLNFNNRRQIVELRITVPGHPEKRPKLISYQDLEVRGLTENTVNRVTGGVYSYKREPAPVREARLNLLDALMQEKEKEVTQALGNPSHGITIRFIVDQWQKEKMPALKIGKRSSVPGWQKLWVSLIGDMQADQLDQFKINEITRTWKEEGLKNATLNARCVALSRVFTWAKKTHRYAKNWSNPFSNAEWFPTTPKVIYLTKEEISKLIPALKASETKDLHDAVILALFTGLRSSELFSLTWKDVDMLKGVATISDRKSGDNLSVSLGSQSIKILKNRSRLRVLGNDLIFINPNTGRAYGDLNESLKNALRRAGIEKPGFSWHCLRHSCASLLASQGFSLMEIANHLGHKDLKSVQCYAHLAPDHNRITANALDEHLAIVNL